MPHRCSQACKTPCLREAEQARPNFETDLNDLAEGAPGTTVIGPRVKKEPRLQEKIDDLHEELRDKGIEPGSPDTGAHLIRDYVAGKLVVRDQAGLDAVLRDVERRFGTVGEPKNFMAKPNPETGYTAIHLQVKLPNGMTAELQIQPAPFKRAADEQRELFEKWRVFGGDVPDEKYQAYQADLRRSREIFSKAWNEWLSLGGREVRKQKPLP